MDELKWDDLQVFLVAHASGSFSAAARQLHMEQSTVSRRIAALESALGSAVFLRSRQGLVLTDLGERILPLALEARQRVEELASISRGDRVDGVVRLALTESLAVYGLTGLLGDLLGAHPGLRLHLVNSTTLSDLSRREADIALRLARTARGDLVTKSVAQLPNGIWGHARWADVGWGELEWVSLSADIGEGRAHGWVEANAARTPRLVTNGFLAMVEAMRHGLGVGLVPDALAAQVPGLVRIDQDGHSAPPTSVYLVTHRASRGVPRIAAVWSFLEQALRTIAATAG